jgi:poly-gamma-glutamate synthesis protein (capsule biosynthesis protein)
MTGRGIDQIMRHPCDPRIYEDYAHSAMDYVRLAERLDGPIPRKVDPSYIWGAALEQFARAQPDARIINLETAITRSEDFAPKGINYRMSPENADCLSAARIDCCVLANNHVLDWGPAGLLETLAILEGRHIRTVGAGRAASDAGAPVVLDIPGKCRVAVLALACETSGTPQGWAATPTRPGVNFLSEVSVQAAKRIGDQLARTRDRFHAAVVSLHWGPNWGYETMQDQRAFARSLIDEANVSIVYGHSSHHPKGIEVYRDRLILYGCGDFLNDYEGIGGYEKYRGDLTLMYFVDLMSASGALSGIEIVPLRIRRFQLAHASAEDIDWLRQTLDRESKEFRTRVLLKAEGPLTLAW